MTDQKHIIEELHDQLTQAELLVGSLRGTINKVSCMSVTAGLLKEFKEAQEVVFQIFDVAEQALTSTRPYLEKQLEKVERVLVVIEKRDWITKEWKPRCPFCYSFNLNGHTETCELAALKREWEAKRDAIKGELK